MPGVIFRDWTNPVDVLPSIKPAFPVLLAGQHAPPLAAVLGLDRGERCFEAQQQASQLASPRCPPQAVRRLVDVVLALRLQRPLAAQDAGSLSARWRV